MIDYKDPKRLTERDEFGNADIIGVDTADLQFNLDFEQMNLVTDALNKLADYEESNMAAEVERLRAENEKLKKLIPSEPVNTCPHKNLKTYHDNSVICKECSEVIWQGKTLSEPIPVFLREIMARLEG